MSLKIQEGKRTVETIKLLFLWIILELIPVSAVKIRFVKITKQSSQGGFCLMMVETSTRRQMQGLQREGTDTPATRCCHCVHRDARCLSGPRSFGQTSSMDSCPLTFSLCCSPKGKNTKPPPGVLPAPGMLSSHSAKPHVGSIKKRHSC